MAHWGVHSPLQATKADYEAVGDILPERLRVYAAMTRALAQGVRLVDLLETARGVDPHIYYSVDLVREYHGGATAALSTPADWRAIFRMRK